MNGNDLSAHVADPARLAALRAVALLDTPTEESFDRLTWLAARFVNAPISLVSLIDANRQFFKSCIGVPEPWLSQRETPLSHSFCQYNRIPRQPLLVEDARTHPLFKNNMAIHDLHVIAYLGIPLVTPDGYVLGSFCVIDTKPRNWSGEDITVVEKLAASVMTEIQLRAEISARHEVEERLKKQNEELGAAYQELETQAAARLLTLEQLRQKDQMMIHESRLAAMGEMMFNISHQWRQPLNIIGLIVQELSLAYQHGGLSQQELHDRTKKVMNVIAYMSKTIDDFRNILSPDRAKTRFSTNEVVDSVLYLMSGELKELKVEVEMSCEEECFVDGYRNEYLQVILNIINNARDVLRERRVAEPRIKIKLFREGGRSVVTIADNGGGIAPEIQGRIFEPYFTTKGPDKGTGIGLYMSKMIIEKNMGGILTVRNSPDGAEFRIEV